MTTTAEPTAPARHRVLPRILDWPSYSVAGTAMALLFGSAAFLPSLLPRGWLLQGIIQGLSAAAGYAIGAFLGWLAHALTGRRPSGTLRRWLWLVVVALGVPVLLASMVLGYSDQHALHAVMGEQLPRPYDWIGTLVVTVGVLVVLVTIAQLLRWGIHRIALRLSPRVPDRLARALAVVIVLVLLILVNNGLLWRGLVNIANTSFGAVDITTTEGTTQPTSPERSGSPASMIEWDTLGRQGRDFVALGPTVEDLGRFSGEPAEVPVRVYAGLRSAETTGERAGLAIRDLRRAGGFDRAALVVATTTGTGYLEPASSAAIEYLYNGDTAIVGIQYSYLPSWISFLVDDEEAKEAGRELFNQVHAAWSELDPDDRPLLLVTGTSLGAFGSEAAFSSLADIVNRTDGVVWAGPPHASRLYRGFVEQRDRGTPQWLPVYDGGGSVRFAATPEDLWAPGPTWEHPRVVYLQHASDPIVFWDPRLAIARPDWLTEPRGPGVSDDMTWVPVVTFWQVSADLPWGLEVPPGYGHHYREMFADAWAAVAAPDGWTDADTQRLREELAARDAPAAGSSITNGTRP